MKAKGSRYLSHSSRGFTVSMDTVLQSWKIPPRPRLQCATTDCTKFVVTRLQYCVHGDSHCMREQSQHIHGYTFSWLWWNICREYAWSSCLIARRNDTRSLENEPRGVIATGSEVLRFWVPIFKLLISSCDGREMLWSKMISVCLKAFLIKHIEFRMDMTFRGHELCLAGRWWCGQKACWSQWQANKLCLQAIHMIVSGNQWQPFHEKVLRSCQLIC